MNPKLLLIIRKTVLVFFIFLFTFNGNGGCSPGDKDRWEWLKAFIMCEVFKVCPGATQVNCPASECQKAVDVVTHTPGYCKLGSGGNESWITASSPRCGRTKQGGDNNGVEFPSRCITSLCGSTQISSSSQAIGYDALPADNVPAEVNTVSPRNQLDATHEIVIQFTEQMDPTFLSSSGSMAGEVSEDYTWSQTGVFNDTLSIKAKTEWAVGTGRTLSLNVKDEQGNDSTVNLNYNVRNFQAEENAARAAIQAKRNASFGFGFPTTDVTRILDSPDFLQNFADHFGAVIYYRPGVDTFSVQGGILTQYGITGGHLGTLGFPTSDEHTCALLMRCSTFENGWIDFDEISKVTRVFYY